MTLGAATQPRANVGAIIDGKAHAAGLGDRIARHVQAFAAHAGRAPGLAVVLVGTDPASEVYVRSKGRMARKLGMESFEHVLPQTVSQPDLMALVARLNADRAVDGILVQLPLPRGLDSLAVIKAIDPATFTDHQQMMLETAEKELVLCCDRVEEQLDARRNPPPKAVAWCRPTRPPTRC